jgi:hypothetical protein
VIDAIFIAGTFGFLALVTYYGIVEVICEYREHRRSQRSLWDDGWSCGEVKSLEQIRRHCRVSTERSQLRRGA